MDLSKILAVNGKSGLFKLVSHARNSFIVESLIDGKRFPAFSQDGVANLENISIFTEDDEVSLQSVFQSIYKKENGAKVTINLSDNKLLKEFFGEVLPNYDRERVYVSNIKKVIVWYNLLMDHQLIDLEEPQKEESPKEGSPKEESQE